MIANEKLTLALISNEMAHLLKQRGAFDEFPKISVHMDSLREEFTVFWNGKRYYITNVSDSMFRDSLDNFSARILQPLVETMLQPENVDD